MHNDSQHLTPTTLGAVVDNVLPTIDFKSLTGRISFAGRQRAFGVYEFLEHDGNAWLSSGSFEVQNQTGGQTVLPDGMSSIGGFGYRDMIILISGVGFALLLFSSVGLFYFCRWRRTKEPEKTLLERIFLDGIPNHPHDSMLRWRKRFSGTMENVFHGSRADRTHAKFADVGFSDSGHLSPEHHHHSHMHSGTHAHGHHFGSVEVSGGNFGGSSAMHHHASRRTSEAHGAPRRGSEPRDTNTPHHSHNKESSRDLRRHHHHHHHRHHDHGEEDPLELTPPPRADVVVAAGVRQGVFDPWMNQWARQQGSQVASRPLHR
jgi:hypothetical protein